MASSHEESTVGIFWLFRGRLITDLISLSAAEPYGQCLTHPRGHLRVWTDLQSRGVVPVDVEYEEPPRGRTLYDKSRDRFVLLADPCILKREAVVRRIMTNMHLPDAKTETGRDAHYRCAKCLAKSGDSE
jgi:hypothetical protein